MLRDESNAGGWVQPRLAYLVLLEVDLKAIVTDEEGLPMQSLRADPSA